MNKKFILAIMVDSFKFENIKMAINSGMSDPEAHAAIDSMTEFIQKGMTAVLDTLIENKIIENAID